MQKSDFRRILNISDDGSVMGEFGIYKKKPAILDKIVRKGYKDIEDIFK